MRASRDCAMVVAASRTLASLIGAEATSRSAMHSPILVLPLQVCPSRLEGLAGLTHYATIELV